MEPRARRELSVAVGLCLVGSALALVAGVSPWVVALVDPGAPLPASRQTLVGSDAAPGVPALALLGLAAVAALLAARWLARLGVGAVLVVAGAGLAALAVPYVTQPAAGARAVVGESDGLPLDAVREVVVTGWPWVAAAGGVLLALAGALTLARGRSWSGLSGRYDAPGAPAQSRPARDRPAQRADPDAADWDALDRGEDPTA